MRLYNNRQNAFTVAAAIQEVEGDMASEKIRLERRMKQAAAWQKRLNELNDPRASLKVGELLRKFEGLVQENGMVFTKKPAVGGFRYYTKYVKGDVTLDMYMDLNVTPTKLWANFYDSKKSGCPFRIYIGKEVRITNKILAHLLK